MEKCSLSDFVGEKHVDLKKFLQLSPRAHINRNERFTPTGRFKGHYFSFRCWSRGRQRRPQRRPGEQGKGSPHLRFCALCTGFLPATFLLRASGSSGNVNKRRPRRSERAKYRIRGRNRKGVGEKKAAGRQLEQSAQKRRHGLSSPLPLAYAVACAAVRATSTETRNSALENGP